MAWEENKHPRDENGQFASKESDFDLTDDSDFDTSLHDNSTILGIKKYNQHNMDDDSLDVDNVYKNVLKAELENNEDFKEDILNVTMNYAIEDGLQNLYDSDEDKLEEICDEYNIDDFENFSLDTHTNDELKEIYSKLNELGVIENDDNADIINGILKKDYRLVSDTLSETNEYQFIKDFVKKEKNKMYYQNWDEMQDEIVDFSKKLPKVHKGYDFDYQIEASRSWNAGENPSHYLKMTIYKDGKYVDEIEERISDGHDNGSGETYFTFGKLYKHYDDFTNALKESMLDKIDVAINNFEIEQE